ncbi:hypothetical protein C0995_012750 [Termitomyces sp. Mi166|nr:hypothetical protein C0995_012750 [Termitomyces sp. Mi166\
MDLEHRHSTRVDAVRACYNDDATDLLAVAGEHSVDVLLISDSDCQTLASFYIGPHTTALAWSPLTVSPTVSDNWHIQLAVADADFGLHLLTKSSQGDESIFPFGGGMTGHHGKVNDMTFCGGRGEDSSRYLATVSDDKMLMIWDLQPSVDPPSPEQSPDSEDRDDRPQPTAYVIAFPNPLTAIDSHPSTSKEFLVSDCCGSIFLTDWRSDPQEMDEDVWRHSSLLELVEPSALSDLTMGSSTRWSASVAWRRDTSDIIGAVYGSKFSIWDIGNLQGGKPLASGISFPEAGYRFRWCPTYPDYFAISAQTPVQGAIIHIHNTNYLQAQPTEFSLFQKPHFIQDFDFLGLRGIPRIAAAVGKKIYIFPIGVDG